MRTSIRTFLMGMTAAVVLVAQTAGFAATQSVGPISINAIVGTGMTLTVVMKKNDFSGVTVTSMDFGTLQNIGTGTLRSSPTGSTGTGAVDVFLSANSHGLPYTITQTATQLSNGITTIAGGSSTVVPVYSPADNGGAALPIGASLGTKGTWVATNKLLYQSEGGAAAARTIQAFYSITDDPAAGATTGVPLDQSGGAYSATVTFTLTA